MHKNEVDEGFNISDSGGEMKGAQNHPPRASYRIERKRGRWSAKEPHLKGPSHPEISSNFACEQWGDQFWGWASEDKSRGGVDKRSEKRD